MPTLIQLPPVKIIRGQTADFAWRLRSAYPTPQSPVDLSTWTATFTISKMVGSVAVLTATPAMDADGNISVSLNATQTAALQSFDEISGNDAAAYQLNLNAPSPELNQVWQGGVIIAEATN